MYYYFCAFTTQNCHNKYIFNLKIIQFQKKFVALVINFKDYYSFKVSYFLYIFLRI